MTAAEAGKGKPKGAAFSRGKKWSATAWLCFGVALIPIVSFIIFSGLPVMLSFISMFVTMDYNMLDTMEWNNFENFRTVFTDGTFWQSWKVTLILATTQFISLGVALLISVLLEQKVKGGKALQALYFMPYICSSVAISIMWQWVFSKDMGILNAILGQKIDWLNDVEHPYRLTAAIYVTILWQAPAYGIVMFKAALKNVNPSLYEAAEIDGANGFKKFLHVTLPGIKAVTLFLILAGITTGLGIFDQVLILAPLAWTGVAGPDNAGLTINYYIYNEGISFSEMEISAVASWFLFVVTFVITYPIVRARNKASQEG